MALWVFGYGSLLWNPGFEVAETVPARLTGYTRQLLYVVDPSSWNR